MGCIRYEKSPNSCTVEHGVHFLLLVYFFWGGRTCLEKALDDFVIMFCIYTATKECVCKQKAAREEEDRKCQ
jgi:hypothetical protein